MEQLMIDEEGIEYSIFSWTFFFLKLTGFWLPTTVKQPWSRFCYYVYTISGSAGISTFYIGILCEIMNLNGNRFVELVNSWYVIAVGIHIHIRGLNVARNRTGIVRLLREKIVVKRWTNLRDAEEIAMVESSRIAEQNLMIYWMAVVAATSATNIFNPIISYNPDNKLIYSCWTPCDTHVPVCFWILWSIQAIIYSIASITQVSCDCILLNSIQRICTHFRILQHRLMIMPNLVSEGILNTAQKERSYLIECILDHQNIYSSINEISQMFNITIFIYFTLSFSMLCTNIYILSKQQLFTSDFFAVSLYLICMMAQSFINCCYGYKLTRIGNETAYAIYSMNWLELRSETRKILRFIMLSASKNISLFNNCIVELSPEMFLKMLKISYSAFNLLQTRY